MADSLVLIHTLPEEYAAFKAKDRRKIRLQLRPAGASWEWLPYGYMLRLIAGQDGRGLTLCYSFLTVFVTGRNLFDVADAIAEEHCDFIEAYDATRWPKPNDASTAFIERIEIVTDRSPAGA